MTLHLIPAIALVGSTSLAVLPSLSSAPTQAGAGQPRVVDVSSVGVEKNAQLSSLIAEIRSQADAFVFLSGGASRMREDRQRQLLAMFEALALVAKGGRGIAVGDGGTQAGIMEAAGHTRRASGNAFPLIGVAPAREIPPRGKTPIDPNHSHVVAVDNPSAPALDSWGSETETMYWLFAKLAEGRPSVTIVANGGGVTLREVESNVRAGRRMILIKGSGRAADALVSLLDKTEVSDAEIVSLRKRAEKARLMQRPELFQIVALEGGAPSLRDAITALIGGARQGHFRAFFCSNLVAVLGLSIDAGHAALDPAYRERLARIAAVDFCDGAVRGMRCPADARRRPRVHVRSWRWTDMPDASPRS